MCEIIKQITYAYKGIFRDLKKCRGSRKEYKIVPCIRFFTTRNLFTFSILPVIVWIPWVYRQPGWHVWEIHWFNFVIAIGDWKVRGGG